MDLIYALVGCLAIGLMLGALAADMILAARHGGWECQRYHALGGRWYVVVLAAVLALFLAAAWAR
jgi:hypothetical protein